MFKATIIILSGDHGAGKSTIAQGIIEAYDWVNLVPQYTSRKPRNDGQETENFFVSVDEVMQCEIVGEYRDGDGTSFMLGYRLADIEYALINGYFPLLIGHKAIIQELRSVLPKSATVEIFLKCNKKIAAEKILKAGGSTPEKAKARLERGWESTADTRYTDYIVENNYDESTIYGVLELLRRTRMTTLPGFTMQGFHNIDNLLVGRV